MRNQKRNRAATVGGLTIPLPMIDVFGLTLLFTLLKSQFMVERVELPALTQPTEASVVTPTDSPPGIQIALMANGDVIYRGEPVAVKDVSARITAEADQDRPILLCIETTPEGIGPLTALLQVQTDLTNAGIIDRVQVLSRTTARNADDAESNKPKLSEETKP